MSVYKNFIANEWVEGKEAIANINPSDVSDCIGHYALATSEQMEDAIAAAHLALPLCQKLSLEKKQQILNQIGQQLMDRADELGRLLSREEGKPFLEGRGEVYRAGQFFTYYAAEVLRQFGETSDSVRVGVEINVYREPVGVVAVISPWNFPTATASWKIAPALAFGNAVIWKPAQQTPASAHALAEIIANTDLPAGAFQLLMGRGSDIGEQLVTHPGVDAVTFTGSHQVGSKMIVQATTHLAKCQLEMGSKNALTVMEDADLEKALMATMVGGYSGTGQKCTASSRLLLHHSIHDEFIEKLLQKVQALKVGHALEEGTQMGPVVSEAQLNSNLNWIENIKKEGGEIIYGGERLSLEKEGFYMSPALITNTSNTMSFNRHELFAPIVATQKIDSLEEAIQLTNDTDYGLVSGIFTSSLARANTFRRLAQTGCVMVNLPTAGTDYHVPFGGRKNSSYGWREQGRVAIEFFTQMKTVYLQSE